MRRAPPRPMRAWFVRTCCAVVVWEHDLRATPVQCNAKRTLFFAVRTTLFAPRTSHFTLRTLHSTLHLISPHLSSSHLIPSLLTCHLSKFSSTVFISSEHWSTFLTSSKFVSTHLSCSASQKALTVREKSLAQKKHWAQKAFAHRSLGQRCNYAEKPSQNTFYHKACTKHFPLLLCTTKLAQSTSQYDFALQSLHKALPSTTLYYKACT